MLKTVYLANPRGFCAGVKYAISYVEEVQKLSNSPIYVRKEIVHNKRVVEEMTKKGIRFVNELEDVPKGETVIFSAHGVSPEVVQNAKDRGLVFGDATCPLVTRVHKKAKNIKDTHNIIYIGHAGHEEAIGTMGEAKMHLVETPEDVEKLKDVFMDSKPITYLMQTTLSVSDTKQIVEKISEIFPHVEHPQKDDICYATTERQEAVTQMLEGVDAICVIGSPNSSNSVRLLQLAKKKLEKSFQISNVRELDISYLEEQNIQILGITAGASSPQILIDEIIEKLQKAYPNLEVKDYPNSREDVMNFKLPKNLLQASN